MADIKALITTVVTPLVQHPDDIQVTFKETQRYLEYNLTVNPEDIGRVIGRQGRVASAIRTIVYSVRVSGPKRVRLTIEDGQQKNSWASSDVLFKSFFITLIKLVDRFFGSLSTAVDEELYEETNSFSNWFPFFVLNCKFNPNSCVKTRPIFVPVRRPFDLLYFAINAL